MWHLIGSNGFIATRLQQRKIPQPYLRYARGLNNYDVELDLTKPDQWDISKIHKGDFVVFLAANSSPDFCSEQPEKARMVNVNGTGQLIGKCLDLGAQVLFFSSDTVIGATDSPCDETAEPHPFGAYAAMKREVELQFCREPGFKVFRLSYVFSREDKFFKYLASCLKIREKADVFDALYRNVIYIEDVIDAIIRLSETFDQWENSVFHLSGPELLSRKDMAEIFRTVVDNALDYSVRVPGQEFFAARPNRIETTSKYLKQLLGRCPTLFYDAVATEFNDKR